ncbi:hypothetical protein B6U99_03040 [Candidatus Geothermarchaeota archaeon ex4572_27]|nr:MAG: hypothetical protein B6U99_03040 [Candidatus Geothermarchaeota archaeon ex4572_27]
MRSGIFKDPSKLLPTYVPSRIPHREGEFKQLLDIFGPVVRGEEHYNHAVVVGSPGVGKTMLVRYLERHIRGEAEERGVRVLYVNYRVERIPGNIVRRLVSTLIPGMPLRGYSIGEMFRAVLSELQRRGERLLLILDDADSAFYRDREFVYMLTRADEVIQGPNPLSLIFVVHFEDALSRLDPWTMGGLRKNVLKLSEYSFEQLVDILDARVEEAFVDGAVPRETIETCADISSTYGHNARYAIELLLNGGRIAEQMGCGEVKPEHIRQARDRVPPSFSVEDLKHLSLHEKLILYSLSRILLATNKAFVTTGDLEEEYRAVCREAMVKPISHTWFWNELKTLSYYGLISRRESGKGYRGRTTLVGLPSFSAKFLEQILQSEVFGRP